MHGKATWGRRKKSSITLKGTDVHQLPVLVAGCNSESQSGWMMLAAKTGSCSVHSILYCKQCANRAISKLFLFLESWQSKKKLYLNAKYLWLWRDLIYFVCPSRASWGQSSWVTSSLTLSSLVGSSTVSWAKRCSTETTAWLAGKHRDPF